MIGLKYFASNGVDTCGSATARVNDTSPCNHSRCNVLGGSLLMQYLFPALSELVRRDYEVGELSITIDRCHRPGIVSHVHVGIGYSLLYIIFKISNY